MTPQSSPKIFVIFVVRIVDRDLDDRKLGAIGTLRPPKAKIESVCVTNVHRYIPIVGTHSRPISIIKSSMNPGFSRGAFFKLEVGYPRGLLITRQLPTT
jgi:hypothetical protein